MDRCQTCGDLTNNFQSDFWIKSSAALDEVAQRLPFYILHRIKIALADLSKMKYRGNIWMADAGCSSCLPYKAPARRFIADKQGVNHLQRHRASQIDIDRLVRHSHHTGPSPSGFPNSPVRIW